MKTEAEIKAAREFIYCEMGRADINELQRCILDGMLVALRWVTDGGKNQNTLQRLLDGTPIKTGGKR